MTRKFKNLLHFTLTGTFSIVLAACYGAPVQLQDYKLIKATDPDNNPIEGLQVDLSSQDQVLKTQYTDQYGVVEFNDITQTTVSIKITDVDGIDNGGEFEAQEFEANRDDEFEITLTKKQ